MSAADAQAIVPAALFCFSLAQNMRDKLTTYAFCYDQSYQRGNPMAALGVRGYDVRIIHIRDAVACDFIRQRGGLVIPKLDGYRRADEVKDLVSMWVREFGELIPFIKLPDEPTANNISVEQMVEMARAIREVTDIPIEVNLMADGANIVYAFALAPYIEILSTDAYCNATPECNVNTMQTVRVAMMWLVDVFTAAGMSAEKGQGIGFIAQGFRMTRCRAELQARSVEFGDPMFEMVFAALKEIIGDLLRVLGIYAWLDVDKPGTDGDMPSLHEDTWPPIRRFTARLDGYYDAPAPEPQKQTPPDIVINSFNEFAFYVSQDRWERDARFDVIVDGQTVAKAVAVDASAIHANDVWQKVVVRAPTAPGKRELGVRFANDAYGGPGKDLNLYVRDAVQDGAAMKPTSSGGLYFPLQTAWFDTGDRVAA